MSLLTTNKVGSDNVNMSFELTCSLTEREKEILFHNLECSDDEELSDKLERIANAAMNEYLDMILGNHLPTRADEMREQRVYYLLKHFFIDRFPTESEICQLFQTTESGSRTILRNVRAKYKFEVQEHIRNSVELALSTAEENSEKNHYVVTIKSENVLEEMKQLVSRKAPQYGQIAKKRNSAGLYIIPSDTYNVLIGEYRDDTDLPTAAGE
jgi:hypothetical protein